MAQSERLGPGAHHPETPENQRIVDILLVFLRLGSTSFGGPIAHFGYFHDEFVTRRQWLSEAAFADLVALCQFLPGPASSQVGIGIGLSKGGLAGALVAWIGFTLPSTLLMIAFGWGILSFQGAAASGALHGLKVVAVAVVAQAVWTMARRMCADVPRAAMALGSAAILVLVPLPLMQFTVILAGGGLGLILLPKTAQPDHAPLRFSIDPRWSIAALVLFFGLLVGLPLLSAAVPDQTLRVFGRFYATGSLVFGGGHVVLPLLQAEVVPTGWVTNDVFLAGYGAAQAVPGPLFTFSAYLGEVLTVPPNGPWGAVICLVAIFFPSFPLLVGTLPFWDRLRHIAAMQKALKGVNAAVVGVLLAALYNPVWTNAIFSIWDFALALTAFALLAYMRAAPWLVVVLTALAGGALGLVA